MSSNSPSSPERPRTKAEVVPGDVLAGKFRVERVVGRGGMGVVVEATNIQLDQKVALKLLAAGVDDSSAVERFNGEARAAARLRSEHVARVYDVGKDTIHGPFIVMEMLEGKTLAEVIATNGRVQIHRAVEYVIDACEGLAEAHARGIVHQDVKPANLFLVTGGDGRPSVKLLDFGIATMRTKGREGVDAKSSHPSLGTPAYLAPEQLRGSSPIDHRADVWALGCVLYELLVAERAFRATRFTELVTKILETPPHPFPDDLELPVELAAAIERCLDKDPTKRFTSSAQLALTLLPFARPRAHLAVTRAVAHVKSGGLDPDLEMPSSMPPPPTSGATLDLPPSANLRAPAVPRFSSNPVSAAADPAPPAPRARGRSGLPLLGLLLLVLVGGVVVWMRRGSSPPLTEASPLASSTPTPSAAASPTAAASAEPASPSPAAVAADPASPPVASASGVLAAPASAASVGRGRGAPKTTKSRPTTSIPGAKPTATESEIRYQR